MKKSIIMNAEPLKLDEDTIKSIKEQLEKIKIEKEMKKTNVTSTDRGWVCPVCGKVNAPWVSACPCSTVGSIPVVPQQPHEWPANPDSIPHYPSKPTNPWESPWTVTYTYSTNTQFHPAFVR